MNNDLISRSELLKVVPSEEVVARMAIANALTVEQPTGEWEFVKPWHLDCNVSIYRCSVCGRTTLVGKEQTVYELYPYCHCGAKMKGGEEE